MNFQVEKISQRVIGNCKNRMLRKKKKIVKECFKPLLVFQKLNKMKSFIIK